ncbi:MAG: formylglycine-generating enzyme family protein [Saprospiraceae bacterium]
MDTAVLKINLPNDFSFEMVFVEGGEFEMGSTEFDDEKPIHEVKLSSYYIGKYLVTQNLWELIMGNNPSDFEGKNRPVEMISWEEVQQFIKRLNELTKRHFQLPSEAEWEYAARGGKHNQGYKYAGSDKLSQVGWYNENSNIKTHEVGKLLANELGLFDMSGNVWEWCEDGYDEKFYKKCKEQGIVENPVNDEEAVFRILRGGSYFFSAEDCRLTNRSKVTRDDRFDTIGFRLALSFNSPGKINF